MHRGLPEMVKGDPSMLRQMISNVLSNAFQHSVKGEIKVDVRSFWVMDNTSMIGFTIEDGWIGMFETRLDDPFQEFEQITDDNHRSLMADSPGKKEPLSLGLAVVARYIRNLNGQIKIRSELAKGTTFDIELPFEHAPTAVRQLQSLRDTPDVEGLDRS